MFIFRVFMAWKKAIGQQIQIIRYTYRLWNRGVARTIFFSFFSDTCCFMYQIYTLKTFSIPNLLQTNHHLVFTLWLCECMPLFVFVFVFILFWLLQRYTIRREKKRKKVKGNFWFIIIDDDIIESLDSSVRCCGCRRCHCRCCVIGLALFNPLLTCDITN